MTLTGKQVRHKNGSTGTLASSYISHAVGNAPSGCIAVDTLGNGLSRQQYNIHYWKTEDIVEAGNQALPMIAKARNA